MSFNKFILTLIVILLFFNLFLFSQSEEDSVEIYDDPAASIQQPETTDSDSEPRLTDLEFSNLSDEEKRNIYFNLPWLLPENFNPDPYMDIFHPETSVLLKSVLSSQRLNVSTRHIHGPAPRNSRSPTR